MVRLLVTRPQPEASETAGRLQALDIEAVVEPLLIARTLPNSLPPAAGFAALAVTSGQALRALGERGELAALTQLPLYAVGDRTAALARTLGFTEVHSAGGDLAALVALIARAGLNGPVLYPAALHRSGDLARALAPHGIMAITSVVYEMVPVTTLTHDLASAGIDGVMLYSRRTAETFVTLARDVAGTAAMTMLCLSEVVAQPLVTARLGRIGLADHPSEQAMLALALSFARDQYPA